VAQLASAAALPFSALWVSKGSKGLLPTPCCPLDGRPLLPTAPPPLPPCNAAAEVHSPIKPSHLATRTVDIEMLRAEDLEYNYDQVRTLGSHQALEGPGTLS